MLAAREIALRLAADRSVDRKLRIASHSRFFWIYALSLFDPDALWKCVSGAAGFALAGAFLMKLSVLPFTAISLTALFEYFLMGLIINWVYHLGPWLHPTNLNVIFTLLFRLYRKNKVAGDLTAEDIGRLFPTSKERGAFGLIERIQFSGAYVRIWKSPVLGSLFMGSLFACLLVALLWVASHLPLH